MSLDSESDNACIERSLAGDRQAFGDLVVRHQRSLRLAIAWHVDDPALIDEVVQEAFVTAFEHVSECDPERPFFPWLRQIALNVLRMHFRRMQLRHRHQPLLAVHVHNQIDADSPAEDGLLDALRHCLTALSASARALLEERYGRDGDLESLADQLQTTIPSIKTRLYRLRQHLRRCAETRLRGEA